jgi:hypothetical protein
VLAPPGTSIAALSEAFDGYSGGLVRSWTNSTAFDQPIDVREGYAFFAPRLMSAIWDDFLARARPSMDELQLQDLEARASKYLFKIQAKKRGKVVFSQAPSHYMIQYRMFEELYTILLNGKANDLWRLEPKLKHFKTYVEAEHSVLEDWIRRGFKSQIEEATSELEAVRMSPDWRPWSTARAMFENNKFPIDPDVGVSQTFLFPPPGAWSEVGSWMRLETNILGSGQNLRYQLARIKVVRPWMKIDSLLDGSLKIDTDLPSNLGYQLSDGTSPSFERTPAGLMPAYVEELLLVRNIRTPNFPGDVPLSSILCPRSRIQRRLICLGS